MLYYSIITLSLRNNEDISMQLVVDYTDKYYYDNINDKMIESLSVNNCTLSGLHGEHNIGDKDLYVEIIKPSNNIINKWLNNPEFSRKRNTFYRTSEELCNHKQFKDFYKGFYKKAKGCEDVYVIDPMTGRKNKTVIQWGFTLHPAAFRCDNKRAFMACHTSAKKPAVLLSDERDLHQYPFKITTYNAVVSKSGMIALPCGPFGLYTSCEAVKWGVPITASSVHMAEECRKADGESSCPIRKYDKVFIGSQYDDTQIGQFILEDLPKIVFHLDYIKANPDVKIHYGFSKLDELPKFVLPQLYFKWLGLEDRLVNGTVYATEIVYPREGACQDIAFNAWEMLNQREVFLKLIGINTSKETTRHLVDANKKSDGVRRSIIVLRRSASPYTKNQGDYKKRRWPKGTIESSDGGKGTLIIALEKYFPNHQIDIFSDLNSTLMLSPPTQIGMFHNADIVIGMHGAGLTNSMYMSPGGIVVEVVREFDSRHAPIIGIFPRLSAMVGLHHYTYFLSDRIFDSFILAKDIVAYVNELKHEAT